MNPFQRYLAAGVLILVYALTFTHATGGQAQEPEGNYGVGIPEVFLPKYLTYRTQQLNSGTPDVLKINLRYVKGLSRSFTSMVGEAAVNLQSGAFTVSLKGLAPLESYTVWLIDRTESEADPPLPDTAFGLVTFPAVGPTALYCDKSVGMEAGAREFRVGLQLRYPSTLVSGRLSRLPGRQWATQSIARDGDVPAPGPLDP